MRLRNVWIVTLGVVLPGLLPCMKAEVLYNVTDLGSLGPYEYDSSWGSGINNAGQVVGYSYLGPPDNFFHAFLYTGGPLQDLGTPGGCCSDASAINDAGQVVGAAWNSLNQYHAFLYDAGQMTDLGTLPGLPGSWAFGVNNSGQVVGQSELIGGGDSHAFLYSNGQMTDLGPGEARGINNAGQITGSIQITDSSSHAFLYTAGHMQDLGTLGGSNSYGLAINSAGQVVGFSYTLGTDFDSSHAFLYAGGGMIDLGTLAGGTLSEAWGINDHGQVVGDAGTSGPGNTHAFLYSNGLMVDLNSLINPASGVSLSNARSINDAGDIVADGTNGAGNGRAFLLTPVPEPGTWALCGLAAAVIAAFRRYTSKSTGRCSRMDW